MLQNIQFFSDMPTPLKAGLLLAGGAAPLGILAYVNPQIAIVVLAGMAIVGGLMIVFWKTVRFFKKRKSVPFEHGLKQNTSSIPQGVSEKKRIADLDDLRRKYEEGLETFKAAGKNLYDFPWYMIVGEPGSGKTEAIRHCNIGFPPGLQDEYQGAGGTLNMNWWFTDHAVILDTAGRLMFEEVETGQSSEWKEFLKLLKKSRSNCPINGVFLAIPSDSLIKDTADEIEKKANKIARQFDIIQRTLDVRFPVFVLITKSDLITGFRDFFENVQDPQLQHQIFGWSNPGSLDEPYNSDFIEHQLKAVQGRLYRRRLALVQQMAIDGTDYKDLRQVDALYSFPHNLKKLAPRMGRYLELIFSVGTQWSCKPLFFRGIYFTSAMQEGSALDEELAEALGVSVDSLPDGRVWKRDRAYFLRDLFIRKVFQERGLVTRSTNANRQHTRRKAVLLSTAIVCVLILFSFTWLAYRRFRGSVGDLEKYIAVLADRDEYQYLKVIDSEYEYKGDMKKPFDHVSKSEFHFQLARAIQKSDPQNYPLVSAFLSRAVDRNQLKKSQSILYQNSVLVPFFLSTATLLTAQKEWKEEDMEVLKRLILVRTGQISDEKLGDYSNFLDPLQQYICSFESDQSWEKYPDNRENLHCLLADKEELNTFIKQVRFWDGVRLWAEVDKAIRHSIDNLLKRYSNLNDSVAREDQDLSDGLRELTELFNEYEETEKILLESPSEFIRWHETFLVLGGLKKRIEEVVQKNETIAQSNLRLEEIYSEMIKRQREQIESIGFILEAFPCHPANADRIELPNSRKTAQGITSVGDEKETDKTLPDQERGDTSDGLNYTVLYKELLAQKNTLLQEINAKQTEMERKLRRFDDIFWGRIRERRKYEIRYQAYEITNEFAGIGGSIGFQRLAGCYDRIREIDNIPQISTYNKIDYRSVCRKFMICAALDAVPDEMELLKECISNSEENHWKSGREYNYVIVEKIKGPLDRIEEDIKRGILDDPKIKGKFDSKKEIWDTYRGEYKKYWSETYVIDEIEKRLKFSDLGINAWKDLRKITSDSDVRENVKSAYRTVQEETRTALSVIEDGESRKATDEGRIMEFVEGWAALSSSVKSAREIVDQIFDEIRRREAVWKEKYCVYATKSEDFLMALYRAAFAAGALELLARDVSENLSVSKTEMNKLAQYFPFKRTARDEISSDNLLKVKTGIGNLLPSQESKVSEIALKIYDSEAAFQEAFKKAFQKLQNQINKTLNDFSQVDFTPSEIERYRSINTILNCLPMGDQPYACEISVVPAGRDYYKDSNYRGYNEYKRAFKINNREMGETDPGNSNRYKLTYPDQDVNIQIYQYAGYTGLKQEFTYRGRWAIFRMILDNDRFYRREGMTWYLEYDLSQGDHLYLKVKFEKELPDLKDWPK